MTEYGFPVFTLCSVVLDLLPLTQDVSGTQGLKTERVPIILVLHYLVWFDRVA